MAVVIKEFEVGVDNPPQASGQNTAQTNQPANQTNQPNVPQLLRRLQTRLLRIKTY
jgi:hypothetical protein